MEQNAIEREKRRKQLERKRRKRRQYIIQRCTILGVGLICVGLGYQLIKGLFNKSNKAQEVVQTNQAKKQEDSNSKNPVSTEEEQKVEEGKVALSREDLGKGNLVVVNDNYPLRIYDESELVIIAEENGGAYQVKNKTVKLNKEAVEALNELLADFKKVQGSHALNIVSGYRDFNEQERIHYETLVAQGQEHTNQYVAKPDRSEHHTGLAVDFGIYHSDGTSKEYDGTGIYSWINENAYKYGFVLRYAEEKKEKTGISYEPWHFRYVGKVHAGIMTELNLCLEEYITYLKNYSYYTNPGQSITDSAKNYSIYYVPAENDITYVPVPTSKPYMISGNNIDGFIVTVELNKEVSKAS